MVDKYQTLQSGKAKLVKATVISTGVSEAGDIVGLDTAGRLDVSVLPVGVGAVGTKYRLDTDTIIEEYYEYSLHCKNLILEANLNIVGYLCI